MRPLCGSCGQPIPEDFSAFWEFEIPVEPPTQNLVAYNKGGGRFVYKKYREAFAWHLLAVSRQLRIPIAAGRRRVFITRLYTGHGQQRDRGNVVGGCKPLLDAMVAVKLLRNDTEDDVIDLYDQERADRAGARIRIEELAV